MLISFGCQPVTEQKRETVPPSSSGAEFFKSKCGKCHDLALALEKYRSEEVWYNTITRMKEEHKADITQQEIDLLVKYHVKRQQQEASIFNEKCQQCHPGKVFLEKKLSAEQAREIIKRMQQKAGNTIEDKDIEIIIRYHAQAQQAAVEKNLQGIYDQLTEGQPGKKRGMRLFLEKCSSCHTPTRALTVFKDPEVWAETIKRMQSYSKGAFTDREVTELVDFHVSRQQIELNTFQETCTKCHSDERINSRSMSDEQWLETIKRMQKKAPELISDEKVNLLAAYFHRRELALARIFYGKCGLCHLDSSRGTPPPGTAIQMNGLIVLANEEFGRTLQLRDVNNLLSIHVQRQRRNMQFYESNCTTCHPGGAPKKKESGKEAKEERSRAEWISLIAALQGVELTKEIQNTINSQIDFHLSNIKASIGPAEIPQVPQR